MSRARRAGRRLAERLQRGEAIDLDDCDGEELAATFLPTIRMMAGWSKRISNWKTEPRHRGPTLRMVRELAEAGWVSGTRRSRCLWAGGLPSRSCEISARSIPGVQRSIPARRHSCRRKPAGHLTGRARFRPPGPTMGSPIRRCNTSSAATRCSDHRRVEARRRHRKPSGSRPLQDRATEAPL